MVSWYAVSVMTTACTLMTAAHGITAGWRHAAHTCIEDADNPAHAAACISALEWPGAVRVSMFRNLNVHHLPGLCSTA